MSRLTDLIAQAKARDAQLGADLRVLDLTRAEVRKSVAEAKDAKSLYESALASDYQ